MFGWLKKKEDAVDITQEWFGKLRDLNELGHVWEQLITDIYKDVFSLRKVSSSGDVYLIGEMKRPRKKRLIYNARYLESVSFLPSFIPDYLPLIYDLKVVPAGTPETMIRYKGGIGSHAGKITAEEQWMHDPIRFNKMIGFPDLYEQPKIPDDLYVFQISISGRLFFIKPDGYIYVYAREFERFKKVGQVHDFIRFCIYFILDGWDWYDDGYGREYNTDYFDLKYYP